MGFGKKAKKNETLAFKGKKLWELGLTNEVWVTNCRESKRRE